MHLFNVYLGSRSRPAVYFRVRIVCFITRRSRQPTLARSTRALRRGLQFQDIRLSARDSPEIALQVLVRKLLSWVHHMLTGLATRDGFGGGDSVKKLTALLKNNFPPLLIMQLHVLGCTHKIWVILP